MRLTLALAALATVFVPAAAALAAGSKVFDLEIGDPKHKGQQVAVVLDGITDTSTGELLTPREMAERLADTRILFIGEDHTDMDFHRVQARIMEELHRNGREVMVGPEMNGQTVAGFGAFSDFLKTLAPGDTVTAMVLRDAQTISVAVTVAPR